jgi:hypothetical protein
MNTIVDKDLVERAITVIDNVSGVITIKRLEQKKKSLERSK